MFRVLTFLTSGFVSFLLVSTVVAQQLATGTLEVKPAIEKASKPAPVLEMNGKVKTIDLEAHTLTLKNRRGEQIFMITPETQVKKGRRQLKPTDLKTDSSVTVSYWKREGQMQASVIRIKK